jgi:hypothetical protein
MIVNILIKAFENELFREAIVFNLFKNIFIDPHVVILIVYVWLLPPVPH